MEYHPPCPECESTSSTLRENDTVEVCDDCGCILWEDLG